MSCFRETTEGREAAISYPIDRVTGMDGGSFCPDCGNPLAPEKGTEGWLDEAGKERVGIALSCSTCGAYFGRDNAGRLEKASYILPGATGSGSKRDA